MRNVRAIWRFIEGAGTVAWLATYSGLLVALIAGVKGVFVGFPPVVQVLLAIAVFVVASFAILAVAERVRRFRWRRTPDVEWLRVHIPDGVSLYRPSGDPWVAFLQRVELTNASERRVSLTISLHLKLKGFSEAHMKEHEPAYLSKVLKDAAPLIDWLRCPLTVEPHMTSVGSLGFVLPFTISDALGEDPDLEGSEATLEITDNVTGATASFPVPNTP